MNTENEMNKEVRQLLDSMEEHGKNARRQKELGELIDRLSEKELGTTSPRRVIPLWWVIGAAAAIVLLLWLLIKPSMKQTTDTQQEILVEENRTVDSINSEEKDVVFEEDVVEETLLAEKTNQPGLPPVPSVYPSGLLRDARNDETERLHEGILQEQPIAEAPQTEPLEPQEPTDTANIGYNNIPDANETPSAVQSPKRRVIRSLNLVCYECQKEPEFFTKPVMEDRTLFGQPQDQNMKNGSLALEIKLN